MCAVDLSRGTAYLVAGAVKRGRRAVCGTFLICKDCYLKGTPAPVTGRTRSQATRQTSRAWWIGLVGRGAVLAAEPCLACGLVVVRRAEKLLRG
ncbi:hypothetical protein [Streptomyces sp. NPDC057579]|uniref:hypothetical protein n=1 Tax=Streptomyces sp. NPDC057579 TaxID=3346172 RepID=UPI0036B603D0